ncbi:MAG: HNH endonuclease, partial [Nanoarchaeota archaeon]|nr:HNH endonuclease [Nanoarchaeota archaeon]
VKGTNGNTYEGFGIWYDRKGYPIIWINNKSVKLHVYVWERANGEKPKNHEIHHKDFDKKNYSLDNLELLTISDQGKVHAKWIRKDGKLILKPCKECKKLLPLDKFYPRKALTPSNCCISSSENTSSGSRSSFNMYANLPTKEFCLCKSLYVFSSSFLLKSEPR